MTTHHQIQPAPSTAALWAAVVAAFVSVAGTAMTAIAVPLLVLRATGSAAEAGIVAFCELAPYLVAQFVGGPLVDRLGHRRSAILGNVVAGSAVCAAPLLLLVERPHLWALCALFAVAGASRGIADGGTAVLVPLLATAARVSMARASGLNNTALRAGTVLGSLLGGVLLSASSPAVVIVGDGASFLAAAGLFMAIGSSWARTPDTAPSDHAPTSYRRLLSAGFAFLTRQRLVLALAVFSSATNLLASGLSGIMLQDWSVRRLVDPAALGLIFAAMGLGQVFGSVLASWWAGRMPRHRVFVLGFLLGGPPLYLVPGLSGDVVLVAIVAAVSGTVLGLVNPILGAVYYERIPQEMLARVLGTIRAIAWVGVAAGPVVAGALVARLGSGPTLIGSGVLFAVLALIPLVAPVFRELGSTPDRRIDPSTAQAEEPIIAADSSDQATPDTAPAGSPGVSAVPRLPEQRRAAPARDRPAPAGQPIRRAR